MQLAATLSVQVLTEQQGELPQEQQCECGSWATGMTGRGCCCGAGCEQRMTVLLRL